ncbi:MAG TPA: energy-coupling factor transporter transmembrane protein EcfT [Firmicutes bacterium]|nr:energy-coupling factor transporter transmembrane protein EcfT [Bacillota bacterium]
MFSSITIGQHIPGDSVIHRLDPRTKILLTLAVVIGIFFVEELWGYVLLFLFVGAAVALSRISPGYIVRGLRPLVIILILTFLLHLFMNPGKELFRLGPLIATYAGVYKGVLMVGRLVLLVVATSLLTLTTSPIQLTDGMEALLRPARRIGVPAHELAMMMTIALRFIPTLLEETEKIMKAQMARGADFESGNIFQRAKSLVPLLVPLFVIAFRRADELAIAMEARCYRGGEGRTRMRQLKATTDDYVASLVTVTFIVVVAVFL